MSNRPKKAPEGTVSINWAANELKIHRSYVLRWVLDSRLPAQSVWCADQLRWFVKMEDVLNSSLVKSFLAQRGRCVSEIEKRPDPEIKLMAKVYEKRRSTPSVLEPLYAGAR